MTEDARGSSRRRFLASATLVAASGCIGTDPRGGDDSTTETAPGTSTETAARATPTAVADVGRFANPDNWTAVDGDVRADGSDPFVGSRSMKLSCGTSRKRAMATYRPPWPVDLGDQYPSLAFRYGPHCTGGNFVIWIEAPDVENRLVYERAARPGNGWIETPLSTPDAVVGDPDLSNVRGLTFHEFTGGGESVSIWLDGLGLHDRPETSAVLFTFDDGHRSVAETARPILAEYGHAGSVAAIPGRESRDSRLSIEQLSALHEGDWDVVSHPQRSEPLPAFSPARQEELIADSKAWLEDQGFGRGARFFVYPYGRWERTTLDLVSEYHDAAFAGRGATTWSPPMPTLASRVKGDDPAVVRSYLDRLSTYGGVVSLMYHAVGSGSEWISTASFRDVVAAVDESDVEVLTMSDWYESSPYG